MRPERAGNLGCVGLPAFRRPWSGRAPAGTCRTGLNGRNLSDPTPPCRSASWRKVKAARPQGSCPPFADALTAPSRELAGARALPPRYGAPEPEYPRRVKSSMNHASSAALKDLTSYHVPPSDIAGARPEAPRLPSSNAAASGAVISTALWNRMPKSNTSLPG
jgi:hypothetical protein